MMEAEGAIIRSKAKSRRRENADAIDRNFQRFQNRSVVRGLRSNRTLSGNPYHYSLKLRNSLECLVFRVVSAVRNGFPFRGYRSTRE